MSRELLHDGSSPARVRWRLVETAAEIEVRLGGDGPRADAAAEAEAERIWAAARVANPSLTEGTVLCYAGHEKEGTRLVVRCFTAPYSHVLARLRRPDLSLLCEPLGVCGVVVDPRGGTVVGRRATGTTEYEGHYEFVPSGGIAASFATDGGVAYEDQLLLELLEEVAVPSGQVHSVRPLGLIHDPANRVYNLCCRIGILETVEEVVARARRDRPPDEYDDLQALAWEDVPGFFGHGDRLCVPSVALVFELNRRRGR